MTTSDLLPAVEQQLLSPDTSYVGDVFSSLIHHEEHLFSPEEAKEMIACCLANELTQMQKKDRAFDETRYQMLLRLLPILPDLD